MDDWTYAWSVERLLHHGRIEVLDWSAVYPVGPAIWGAAWSAVLGFSFATLRFSTLALAFGDKALQFERDFLARLNLKPSDTGVSSQLVEQEPLADLAYTATSGVFTNYPCKQANISYTEGLASITRLPWEAFLKLLIYSITYFNKNYY